MMTMMTMTMIPIIMKLETNQRRKEVKKEGRKEGRENDTNNNNDDNDNDGNDYKVIHKP